MRAQRHKKMLLPNACVFPTRDEAAKRSNIDPQHAIQHDVGWNCLIVYPFVLLITHHQLMSLGTRLEPAKVGGVPAQIPGTARRFHGNPVGGKQPCKPPPTSTVTEGASVEKRTCADPYHEPLPIRRGRAERWIGKIGQPKQWSTKLNWASKLPIWWPKRWSVQGGELWGLEHTCKQVARKALVAIPPSQRSLNIIARDRLSLNYIWSHQNGFYLLKGKMRASYNF